MSSVEGLPVIQHFADISGKSLDDGFVYIGTSGLDPVANPISVFWDEALTIPAPNPIRTRNGHPDRSGAPSRFFVSAKSYSFSVKNKNGTDVYSALDSMSASDFEARSATNIWQFARFITSKPSPNDPSTWDWAPAFLAAIQSVTNGKLIVPKGTYNTSPVYAVNTPVTNLEIDFCESTVNCIGARTLGTQFDWEYGVFTFHGADAGVSQTTTLSATLPATDNTWQVNDSSVFVDGDYWMLEIDPANVTDFSTKTVWRMLRVTKVDSATIVRFDYARIFDIPSGTQVKYTKVNPVQNVRIKNLKLVNTLPYAGSVQDMLDASSGVVFYKAYNCHVENLEYVRNPKQAAHFEFSHSCSASRIRMIDPVEDTSGGYNTQFEKSIYFKADSLLSSKERHVFDATASSNGTVSNSRGIDTANSSFTTHGTWEHDIDYENNVGHFQLAGSGPGFGQTALRINVRNHVGTILRAEQNITDLTIENSRFVSTSDLNVDGLSVVNCELLNDVRFTKISSASRRESVIENTYMKIGAGFVDMALGERITMKNCTLPEMANGALVGQGELVLINCKAENTGVSAVALGVPLSRLEIKGGVWSGLPVSVSDSSSQVIVFDDCEMDIANRPDTLALFISTKSSGAIELLYSPRQSSTTGRHVTAITNGSAARIHLRDTELVGGTIRVDAGVIATGWFMRDNVIYNGCVTTLPAAAARIGVGTELTI